MEEQIKADEGDFVGLMFLLLESRSELSISAMLDALDCGPASILI